MNKSKQEFARPNHFISIVRGFATLRIGVFYARSATKHLKKVGGVRYTKHHSSSRNTKMLKPSKDHLLALSSIICGTTALSSGGGPIYAGMAYAFPYVTSGVYRGIPTNVITHLPERVKLAIPVFRMAYLQMQKDLHNSPLKSPTIFKNNEVLIAKTNELISPPQVMVPQQRELENLIKGKAWAFPSELDKSLLREACSCGPKLIVDCQSICVGAYSAFLSMKKRYQVDFTVDPAGASGIEQVLRLKSLQPDILVSADAPVILNKLAIPFEKKFTVTLQPQSLLFLHGGQHNHKKSVFLYPHSSVDHQLAYMVEQRGSIDFELPRMIREKYIEDLADFAHLEEVMEPGDYVFAWDPLRINLLNLGRFSEVPGTHFQLPISLFTKKNHSITSQQMNAFLRLFIAEINYVRSNPVWGLQLLLFDEPFRESLIRGSALRAKRKKKR